MLSNRTVFSYFVLPNYVYLKISKSLKKKFVCIYFGSSKIYLESKYLIIAKIHEKFEKLNF